MKKQSRESSILATKLRHFLEFQQKIILNLPMSFLLLNVRATWQRFEFAIIVTWKPSIKIMAESLLNTEDKTIPLKKSNIDLLLEIIIMDLISRFN